MTTPDLSGEGDPFVRVSLLNGNGMNIALRIASAPAHGSFGAPGAGYARSTPPSGGSSPMISTPRTIGPAALARAFVPAAGAADPQQPNRVAAGGATSDRAEAKQRRRSQAQVNRLPARPVLPFVPAAFDPHTSHRVSA